MPQFAITGPDGSRYQVTAPDGATDQEVLDYVRSNADSAQEPPHPSQEAEGAFTATMLPFSFDPAKDKGHEAATQEARKAGPTIGGLPLYLQSRGINFALPKFITDVLEANDRGVANAYPINEEGTGQRQRARDALAVASSIVPDAAALPVGAAAKVAGPIAKSASPAVAAPSAFAQAAAKPSGSARDQALAAASRIGVDVPKAAASDSYAVRATGAALKDIPVVGEPLVQASEKALGRLEGTVTGVADDLGGSSALSAGYALKDDIVDWMKVGSKKEAAEIYAPVRRLIGNATGPLSRTDIALRQIAKDAQSIGLKPPAVVGELAPAVAKGEMTFDEMQRLRTQIGDRMSGAIVPQPGQDKTALKQIYGALSQDIDFLAAKAGTKAKLAWTQANDAFKKQIASKRDALTKAVGIEGEANPELVASRLTAMASAKRGADITRLRTARETVGDEAWGELASSVAANMGRTKDGFSLSRYRSDYGNLSPAGKDILFSTEHRQALDDVMTIGKRFEELLA